MNQKHKNNFIENKYFKIYVNIIKKSKNRINDCYTEKHHILPKCMGGTNNKNNIAILTAREHFICHKLLTKITEKSNKKKMFFALHRMLYSSNESMLRYFPSSSYYEKLRIIHSTNVKEIMSRPKSKKHLENIKKANIKRTKNKRLEDQHGFEKAKQIKEKMSKSSAGIKNGMYNKTKKISINGIIYNSIKEAANFLNIKERKLRSIAWEKKNPNIFILQ
jgi:hypothetical protein